MLLQKQYDIIEAEPQENPAWKNHLEHNLEVSEPVTLPSNQLWGAFDVLSAQRLHQQCAKSPDIKPQRAHVSGPIQYSYNPPHILFPNSVKLPHLNRLFPYENPAKPPSSTMSVLHQIVRKDGVVL